MKKILICLLVFLSISVFGKTPKNPIAHMTISSDWSWLYTQYYVASEAYEAGVNCSLPLVGWKMFKENTTFYVNVGGKTLVNYIGTDYVSSGGGTFKPTYITYDAGCGIRWGDLVLSVQHYCAHDVDHVDYSSMYQDTSISAFYLFKIPPIFGKSN